MHDAVQACEADPPCEAATIATYAKFRDESREWIHNFTHKHITTVCRAAKAMTLVLNARLRVSSVVVVAECVCITALETSSDSKSGAAARCRKRRAEFRESGGVDTEVVIASEATLAACWIRFSCRSFCCWTVCTVCCCSVEKSDIDVSQSISCMAMTPCSDNARSKTTIRSHNELSTEVSELGGVLISLRREGGALMLLGALYIEEPNK